LPEAPGGVHPGGGTRRNRKPLLNRTDTVAATGPILIVGGMLGALRSEFYKLAQPKPQEAG
jgi:hypothetical protein